MTSGSPSGADLHEPPDYERIVDLVVVCAAVLFTAVSVHHYKGYVEEGLIRAEKRGWDSRPFYTWSGPRLYLLLLLYHVAPILAWRSDRTWHTLLSKALLALSLAPAAALWSSVALGLVRIRIL